MTSGFSQAYARIVSQETGDSDETESLSSWGDNHPVDDDSSVDDPFVPVGPEGEGEANPRNPYRNLVWVNWEYKAQEYLYTEKEVEEGLWQLAFEEFRGMKANGVYCWTNQIPTDIVAVVDTVLRLNTIRSMQLLY